jgi:flagellar hook-associated protein 3 FlgL
MSGSIVNMYDRTVYALSLQTNAMARLQEQASTGSRVNRASDAPSDAYRILGLSTQERTLGNYQESIGDLSGVLQSSSTILSNMDGRLTEMLTLLTQIAGGVLGPDGPAKLASTVDDTLEQLISMANTKQGNQYLFGGNKTTVPPYAVEYTGGVITRVTYQGGDEARDMEVADAVQVEGYRVGDDVFRVDDRQAPEFLGQSGAANGTGTSTVRGDTWLTVTYDSTNYQVSIDDGATFVTVPAGGAANQAVTDSRTGRVLYVDTTGINSTGVELVRVPGTYDVFNTLISLRDMLLNAQGVSDQELLSNINESVASVREVQALLGQANTTIGSEINFLDQLKDSMEDMQFDAQDQRSYLQDADIAQIAVDLSRFEVLYEMSLSIAGKLMSTSLLDFIR